MTEKPVIAGRGLITVRLEGGKNHYWCACGRSKNQPFCDGSHAGTSFSPLEFTSDQTGDYHLCLCKHSKNPPFCDGSHSSI